MDEQQSIALVYLQTDCAAMTIKGVPTHPAFPENRIADKEAALRIVCDTDYICRLAGEAEEVSRVPLAHGVIGQYAMQPVFFEQQSYEIVIEPIGNHQAAFRHENNRIQESVTPVGSQSGILSGVIRFGNEIGLSDLVLLVDGKHCLTLTIEVFPTRICYQADYREILRDVNAEVSGLVFDCLQKTYASFGLSGRQLSSPVEFFAVLRAIYDRFLAAADRILASPHPALRTEHRVLPVQKAGRADRQTIRWLEKHPDRAMRSGSRVLVSQALTAEKHVTFDTAENRLTSYILHSTANRLEAFRQEYSKLHADAEDGLTGQMDAMIHGIRRRLRSGFLRDVEAAPAASGISLVFGMAPGYRQLYRCYLLMQQGLSVTGGIYRASVKDLAVLYKYWCFLKLNSLMKGRYRLISQNIVRVSANGLSVALMEGPQSQVRYWNPGNGEIITLTYHPKEISVPTVAQRPDAVLHLEKKGAGTAYAYIFDAEYRIHAAPEGSRYRQLYGTPGPMEEDIHRLHQYRDAIVRPGSESAYARTMFGAYVLFPYHNGAEYRKHPFFQSIEQVNVGGLPFLPSETHLVSELLDGLIADSPASAFERTALPLGIRQHLTAVDWSRRDVLIGTFRNRAQFEICRKFNFYYIPAERVPAERLPIHYVAMFQTPRVFSQDAGIYYYGEVLHTAYVRRKYIREVPMRSGADPEALYYRYTIREWKPLAKPILPRESAFVNQFTNLFLLEHVEFVPELLLRSEEEYRFYTELKRRTGEAASDEEGVTSGFALGDWKVVFLDGQIHMIQNNVIVNCCSIREFNKRPKAMFEYILAQTDREHIRQLLSRSKQPF